MEEKEEASKDGKNISPRKTNEQIPQSARSTISPRSWVSSENSQWSDEESVSKTATITDLKTGQKPPTASQMTSGVKQASQESDNDAWDNSVSQKIQPIYGAINKQVTVHDFVCCIVLIFFFIATELIDCR